MNGAASDGQRMRPRRLRTVIAVTALVAAGLGAPLVTTAAAVTKTPVAQRATPAAVAASGHEALGLHVDGNRIVNANGQRVQLHGFNNSGAEYACMEGWGIFDDQVSPFTSIPSAEVAAMASWHGANAVRLSLNEQCWLGLAGVPSQYAGAHYRQAIEKYVTLLNAKGFAVILNLHNSAPGNETSLNQEPMPDAHSITFWKQVAKAFKGNTSVLFDVFNEPWPDNQALTSAAWKCWRDGGCTQTSQNGGKSYTAVGMNQLIAAVRSTGARNIIMAGGLNFASSLNKWLKYEPRDPDHELAASLHIYSFGGCTTIGCYNGAPSKVAKHVPLVIGEFGSDLTVGYSTIASGCSPSYSGTTGFDAALLKWATAHHASWLAWTWNDWSDCNALVTDYAGHATTPYGARVRVALLTHRQTAVA
jgi:endoglucanase